MFHRPLLEMLLFTSERIHAGGDVTQTAKGGEACSSR